MGLTTKPMEGLIREASIAPLKGTVYTLGRQALELTAAETLSSIAAINGAQFVLPAMAATLSDEGRLASDLTRKHATLSDDAFFRLLGANKVQAVDVTDYEGAEILCDLNKPLPDVLKGSCDVLVDGSTLDNLFNPAMALISAAQMLKVNGRAAFLNYGNASTYVNGIPYSIFNPLWFYDYFIWNNFSACAIYVIIKVNGRDEVYTISHDHARRRWTDGCIKPISTRFPILLFAFAQRDANSTTERIPTQHAYRSEPDWKEFERAVTRVSALARPHLIRSSDAEREIWVPIGYIHVLPDGQGDYVGGSTEEELFSRQ